MKTKTVLVLPDKHSRWPGCPLGYGLDPRSWKAVLAYAKDHRDEWDAIVDLGDAMDFWALTEKDEFTKNLKFDERVYYTQKDFAFENEILDELELAKNPKTKHYYIQGNHEFRLTRFLRRHPTQRQILDLEENLLLADRGIKYVRYWENKQNLVRFNRTLFGHGRYVNKYHANKHSLSYPGYNFFYGHVHDRQIMRPVTWEYGVTPIVGSMGMLCRYDMHYLNGDPTNWQQAFAKFIFFSDGTFNFFPIEINKHRFASPEGKVYRG